MERLSRSQIDKLGDQLKAGDENVDLLERLEVFRGMFTPVAQRIFPRIEEAIGHFTRRSGKTTASIVAKLRREKTRLSTMQDIEGCRIVVSDIITQNRLVECLLTAFPGARVQDRRVDPSHGYRAVHVIITDELPIAVQLRTEAQHGWAQLAEALGARYGNDLKYGGGPDDLRDALLATSDFLRMMELMMLVKKAYTEPSVTGSFMREAPQLLLSAQRVSHAMSVLMKYDS